MTQELYPKYILKKIESLYQANPVYKHFEQHSL